MNILFAISFGLLAIRLCVAAYNLISRPSLSSYHLKEAQENSQGVFLSILVPARNEEKNIPILIESILNQGFQNFELFVLDDNSTDKTSEMMDLYQKKDSRIRLIRGETLPNDWLGKNWACHQLSLQAKGDIFLFLDADVKVEDGALKKAIHVLKKDKLTLLSLFPEQEMKTLGEKCTVPIMHYILLSLLPLDFIFLLKPPSMSAANGQFMLFDSAIYQHFLFHQQCKREIVEDIKIMQMVKEHHLKGKTLLGNGLVKCRMYHSYSEGIEGFSKNILAGFGNSKIGLLVFLTIVLFVPILMLAYNWVYVFVYFILVLLLRFCISISAKQSVLWNWFLHPIQMGTLMIVALRSITKSNTIKWKGRII